MTTTRIGGGVRVNAGSDAIFPVFVPSVSGQTSVSFSGTTASVALPTGTRVFRIHADQACYLNFGTSGVTATTSNMPFDAGVEILGVAEGNTHVAAIQNSTGGTLTITPMA